MAREYRHTFPFMPANFFPRRMGRARRGDVRTALLLLLDEEARNGYQLMQEMENRSGGVWRPSPGSVYPSLAQLEDEGLVRAEDRDSGRVFVLTDAGRDYVKERRKTGGSPWEEMNDALDHDVGALFGEIKRVAIAAGQIGHMGNTHQVVEARKLLADARRGLYTLLAEDEPND